MKCKPANKATHPQSTKDVSTQQKNKRKSGIKLTTHSTLQPKGHKSYNIWTVSYDVYEMSLPPTHQNEPERKIPFLTSNFLFLTEIKSQKYELNRTEPTEILLHNQQRTTCCLSWLWLWLMMTATSEWSNYNVALQVGYIFLDLKWFSSLGPIPDIHIISSILVGIFIEVYPFQFI